MGKRLDLHALLKGVMGSKEVYFQPPPKLKMTYPCIVYERSNADTIFANNLPYHYQKRYQILVIDEDPDSLFPDKVAALPQCIYDRHYVADNLNHECFYIYF